jgi:hypothetical protein
MAQAGFTSLKYMNADVVLDGGFGGGAPVNTMYFLNTDYIFLRPHSQRNFVEIGGERVNPNQDALVKLIGWMGNRPSPICSSRAFWQLKEHIT